MKMDKSLLAGSTGMLVLGLLRDGDKYGYEMITQLAVRSDDTFVLKEGTLYPILHGLEQSGCLRSYERPSEAGRVRKYYHLTQKGQELLAEKEAEFDLFAGKVRQVLRSGKVMA